MRNEMVFNGKNISAYSAYVATSNFLDGASREVSSFSIPGRSGDMILEKKRYKNFSLTVTVYFLENIKKNAVALRDLLSQSSGYCRYEESLTPDEYRMACFKTSFAMKHSDRKRGDLVLSFDCKPQRWLKLGENPISCVSGQTVKLMNPTGYPAKPVVKVTGTGSFVVAGVLFTLSTNTSVVTIDFERGDAYEENGLIDRNGALTLSEDDFPCLGPGMSQISATGVNLQIIPRWYRI